jgi:hypothetical protein
VAKASKLITVKCPCCEAELYIDPVLSVVIRHEAHERKSPLADFDKAMQHMKGEAERREDAFKKSVESNKNQADILNKKFDEMLRLAKENPDAPPPKRDIDFD